MADPVTTVGMPWMKRLALALAMWLASAAACFAAEDYQPEFASEPAKAFAREYVFAVYPLHNPERIYAAYGPLVDYLSQRMNGVRFRLEASRNYEDFESKIITRGAHFALCNPRHVLVAGKQGYNVFAKVAGDADAYGLILVRADSGIKTVSDLKGKKISFSSSGAVAGTMLPQYFLHSQGLDVNRDVESLYVGSLESAMLNVYHGLSAAAGSWSAPWARFREDHPDMARELVAKWRTEPLIRNGVVVRDDVPPEVVTQVAAILFALRDSDSGRAVLRAIPAPGFEPASAETYVRAQEFLRRFSAEVRPVVE